MYSLFECIFSARITSLIHISIDLLYIRCPGTHKPAWGIAQHDSKKYGLDSSIWQNSSDWPQICWLWLSVDGVGRPSLIAFQDNKEMTLNPLWRMRQKKRIVNVLNLHCPPICNNDISQLFPGRRAHNTHTHKQAVMLWRCFKLLLRLNSSGLHTKEWILISADAHHVWDTSSRICRLYHITVQFLLSD